MSSLLFVNACPREKEISRTESLCRSFLQELCRQEPEETVRERDLRKLDLKELDQKALARRDELAARGFEDESFSLAKEFIAAERILVGAPYWDLSFPAKLKLYLENISVNGLTFRYTETGVEGLCQARKLLYITTAGGIIGEKDFGTQYLAGLAEFFGIPEFYAVRAEGLDIWSQDTEESLAKAKAELKRLAAVF